MPGSPPRPAGEGAESPPPPPPGRCLGKWDRAQLLGVGGQLQGLRSRARDAAVYDPGAGLGRAGLGAASGRGSEPPLLVE
eukprot:COSAG02_NODE_1844_length_10683_cov_622.961357_8_plen_80_part_00